MNIIFNRSILFDYIIKRFTENFIEKNCKINLIFKKLIYLIHIVKNLDKKCIIKNLDNESGFMLK